MAELLVDSVSLVRVETKSARVAVRFEDRSDIRVDGDNRQRDRVDVRGDEVVIRGNDRIDLRLPRGTNLNVGSISGRVEVTGSGGDIRVGTASGNIEVEHAERADLRSISGSLTIHSAGSCRLATKSGRVHLGRVARAEVSTVSGRITIEDATGELRLKSVSGRVEAGIAGRKDVWVSTISGAVTIRLPAGARPELRVKSLTSRPRSEFPEGNDCCISVSTLSGKIELVPE